MKTNFFRTALLISSIATAPVLAITASASGQAIPIAAEAPNDGTLLAGVRMNQASAFDIFAPKAQSNKAKIDYEVFDAALQFVVLRLGQSIRVRARRPDPIIGSRRITGHKSPYRLEGSRVTFSYLNDEYKEQLTAYRQDLERVATDVDITRLNRKEQLAFWFNLHNVTVIEQIALNYPVREPAELRVGPNKELMDEAKILNIRGIPMSLKDIRENIVYPNWNNPDVMYGFFKGNIGGPALQNFAFTGSNVDYILELQANDFVNSLRGFHEASKALKVSTLYEEVRPFYFNDWPNDLKTHLRKHANADVLEELAVNKPIEFDRYEATVADLNGGSRPMTANLNVRVGGRPQGAGMSQETARLLRELAQKTETMKRRGMISNGGGTVTIEDIPTIDVDIPQTTPVPEN